MKKTCVKRWLIPFIVAILSIAMSFCAFAADSSFEEEIKDFPESYKPYLRELHEKYPEWSFVPMVTGLTWEQVINGEISKPTGNKSDKKSLVVSGDSASDIFKSTSSYDYNKSTGVFKQWDSGFVAASRLAVEYFMDPRNFLTEENIFQFELLAYDERYSIEAIEYVLKGSFMADKKITYYNADGDKKTIDKTYAEAIHEAGKKYNINPCYLASKIINEVGTSGSSSVSGKHSTYPGIYNFYNIGATDGTGAITRGLQWASSGSTYSRPWNTPVKSINGGAEFLAETYIKNGQFTGYLQRFNVNPDAYYSLYTHQYMTNLTGALSQGYSSYTSYVKSGLLYNNYVFSIPVYKNMPETDGIYAYAADSINQKGKVINASTSVRTGPSTSYAKLTATNGSAIQLTSGTVVTVLERFETDAYKYSSVLMYPYWYKVSFTYNSKSYTGYIPAGFVDITTKTIVPLGSYDVMTINGGEGNLSLMAVDDTMIKVVDSDTVKFLKAGTSTLIVYDSTGNMSKVSYSASESPSLSAVSSLKATSGSKKAEITFTKDADQTELILTEYNGKLIETATTKNETYTFKSLKPTGKYTVIARSVGSNQYSVSKSVSFAVQPNKVSGLKYTVNDSGDLILSWNAVDSTGYAVYCYDSDKNEYTRMATVKGKTTYTVPQQYASVGTYCIKAYVSFDGKNTYSVLSDKIETKESPAIPQGLKVSSVTETGYTISWDSIKTADGYALYEISDSGTVLVKETTDTSVKITSLAEGSKKTYRLKAYTLKGGTKLYSEYSDELKAVTKPKKVSGLKSTVILSSSVIVSWNASKGADKYDVYFKPQKGEKIFAGMVDTTTATIEGLTQNTDYAIYIVPVIEFGTATEKGEETSVKLTTALSLPENIKLTFKDFTTAVLSWDKNASAKSYEIYRYDDAQKDYVYYKTVSGNSLEIKYLIPEKEYLYKLRSVGKKSDGSENYSAFSIEISVKSTIPEYKGKIKASDVTDSGFTLSWDSAEEAYLYNIYEVSGKTYKKVASTSKTTYNFTKLGKSTLKEYAVSAVYDISSQVFESKKSDSFTVSTKPSEVKNFKAEVSPNKVTLKWSKVKNATCYKVYLYDSETKKYVEKKKVTGTSCELTSLGYGKSHKARIRAYIKTDAGTVSSVLTQVNFTTKPKDIANVKLSAVAKTYQTLKWSKSTGATHYNVYRYDAASDSYKKIKTTTETSYTVKNLKTGTKYSYKIKPVVMKDGKTVVSGNATKVYKFSTK